MNPVAKLDAQALIKRCLLTLHNVQFSWSDSTTVYVSYAKSRPSDPERVELRFARPGDQTKWMLYACSDNLPTGQWELMQSKLLELQQ